MLISLIAFLALLLTHGVSHFTSATTDVTAAAASDNQLYRPEDPSTLTLALIGSGTLAVYFACRRAIRARRPVTLGETRGPHFGALADAAVHSAGEAAEEPSRGAA